MPYPVMLVNWPGHALVVGGGAVALRKTRGLAAAGLPVRVVSPEFAPGFTDLPGVTLVPARYRAGHLRGATLVFACTNDRAVNRRVGLAARTRGLPVLVADAPEESTFVSPAVTRTGGVVAAISTGGASPALAASIRDAIRGVLDKAGRPDLPALRKRRATRRAASS
jgi:siroheme synthase-like protein